MVRGVASVSAALAGWQGSPQTEKTLDGWVPTLFVVLLGIGGAAFIALLLTDARALWVWWRQRHPLVPPMNVGI